MAGKLAFKQLQLRVLQCLAWIVLLIIAVWTVAYPGHEPTAVLMVRAALVLLLTYIIGYATEQSAAVYGIAVCLLVKGIMTMRIAGNLHHGAPDVFADAVILSPNRVLPLLCAVFGGVQFSVGVTLWSATEIFGIFVAHVSPTLAAPDQPLFATIRSSEFSLLAVEFYYIAVAVTCGCTLVHYYKIALNELGEALQARQRFITNMNHEIRTPLVGVLGMADVMLRQREELSPAARGQLQIIIESTNALLGIINNILDASKLQFKMMRSSVMAVHVPTVVKNVLDTFSALITSNNVPTRALVDPAIGDIVETDATHLHHILSNIIGNAIKFSASGRVSIVAGILNPQSGPRPNAAQLLYPQPIEASDSRIDAGNEWTFGRAAVDTMPVFIATSEEQRHHRNQTVTTVAHLVHRRDSSPTTDHRPRLWFKVTDRGIGMAAEDLPRVVEPFQQADNTITRRYGGSGLGLSISCDLVALLGGDLVYASADGEGSIFVITIPCVMAVTPTTRTASFAGGISDDGGSGGGGGGSSGRQLRSHRRRAEVEVVVPRPAHADRGSKDDPGPMTSLQMPLQMPTTSAADSKARPGASGRPVVLAVDDNHINLKVLQRQLEQLGLDWAIAQHGREAVDYVAAYLQAVDRAAAAGEPTTERLDAILMDLHMPVMDGFEAARTIRALEAQREHAHTAAAMPIPIITISADDPDAMGALCRATGMQDYLRKPLVLEDLRLALSQWIPALPPKE